MTNQRIYVGPVVALPMPVGGDESIRGPLAFTPETPDATVASNSLSAVHAARDAAGVGGVIRLPSGLGTYPAGMVALDGQTWNFDPGTTWPTVKVDTDGVNNVTIRGGTCTGQFYLSRNTTGGNGLTLEHIDFASGSKITVEAKNDFTLRNFTATVSINGSWADFWADQVADGTHQNVLIENGILDRIENGANYGSMVGGHGYSLTYGYHNIQIINCRAYMGTAEGATVLTGWYGLEVTYTQDMEVAYCELSGGDVLVSLPNAQRANVHHNIMHQRGGTDTTYGITFWSAEFPAGQDCIFRWNKVDNLGAGSATYFAVVDNNTGGNHCTIQWNNVDRIDYLVNLNNTVPGGDHVITDNRVTNYTAITRFSDSTGHPSTVERNGPTDGPSLADMGL